MPEAAVIDLVTKENYAAGVSPHGDSRVVLVWDLTALTGVVNIEERTRRVTERSHLHRASQGLDGRYVWLYFVTELLTYDM